MRRTDPNGSTTHAVLWFGYILIGVAVYVAAFVQGLATPP